MNRTELCVPTVRTGSVTYEYILDLRESGSPLLLTALVEEGSKT